MRLATFLAAARAAGLTVRHVGTSGNHVEVGRHTGAVWLLGVRITTDDRGRFVSAIRIDVPLELSKNIRTVYAVAAIFEEVFP